MSIAPDPAAPLNYALHAARPPLGGRARAALAAAYLALTFLPCVVIVMAGQLPAKALAATFLAYAFALLPTYGFDHYFLGGRGYSSPLTFGLFILFTAAMLWPLALLSAAPNAWGSRRWRWAIQFYAAAFLIFAAATAWAMTRNGHLFVG